MYKLATRVARKKEPPRETVDTEYELVKEPGQVPYYKRIGDPIKTPQTSEAWREAFKYDQGQLPRLDLGRIPAEGKAVKKTTKITRNTGKKSGLTITDLTQPVTNGRTALPLTDFRQLETPNKWNAIRPAPGLTNGIHKLPMQELVPPEGGYYSGKVAAP